MSISQIYITTCIVVLAVIVLLVLLVSKNKKAGSLTPLTGIDFGFILAGLLWGENRSIGYGLMGVGVILADADIVTSRGRTTPNTSLLR